MIVKKSLKRGVVDACYGGCKLENNNVGWFYNYDPINFREIPNTVSDFVPMVKNKSGLDKAILNKIFMPNVLLSVNEPDLIGGINEMTFDEAFAIHKDIEDKIQPKLLSSPAITKIYGIPWLKKFMEGNNNYKPRVDFIAIHWYDLDPYRFLQYVDDVYNIFNKPIWVTEFSLADWSLKNPSLTQEENIKNFMNITLNGLENRPFVHKYSWFSSPYYPSIIKCSLWNFETKDLTPLGKYYFNANT